MACCNKGFSSSYMILDPEKVRFFDLFCLLFSSNLQKRKFVDSSHPREHNFWHRFFIFLSIVIQKILRFVATPLAWLGRCIETWLNLLSNNGGFIGIILNTLRLRLIKTDSSSDKFLSFIGHLDNRVTLDKGIKHGDVNYFGALSMMASKVSYENEAYIKHIVKDVWKMEFLGIFNFWNDFQEKYTTQAFMMRDKTVNHDTIIISFRGTEPFNAEDWCSDFDISWYEIQGIGKIHGGFMKALGLQKSIGWPNEIDQSDERRRRPLAYYTLREKLRKLLQENDQTKFIVTGHSLGGALAILFPSILIFHEEKLLIERLEGIYTFGQPRVGDKEFGEFMVKALSQYKIRYFRFVYGFDMVPRLPLDDKAFMFKHFGPCIYFDWNYIARILEEEPFRNYFSVLGAVLMRINACMEIARSFTIGWRRGKEYEESVFLRMMRLFGLLVPGIPAHCPQDYVNSTRLGSKQIFLSPPNKNHEDFHNEYDVKIQ